MNKHAYNLILFYVCGLLSAAANNITPTVVAQLPSNLFECSGIDYTGSNAYWMHNDGYGDEQIYKLNGSGSITKTITINGTTNYDWEDAAHDVNRNYMYIGDFGNNACDRTNLHIYRIPHPKNISGTSVTADVINFSYPDQNAFPSPWMNFDAEGFFHLNGLLYLFSKPDGAAVGYTKLYTLPDQPGTYQATLIDSFYTTSRITGADINSDGSAVVLCTGNRIHIFRNWSGVNIFNGSYVKITINGNWTQKEAICFKSISEVYMTDEDGGSGNFLYQIDLSDWIPDMSTSLENIVSTDKKIMAFPNPANEIVNFKLSGAAHADATVILYDIAGNKIKEAKHSEVTGFMSIETGHLPRGLYFYRLFEEGKIVRTERLVVSH